MEPEASYLKQFCGNCRDETDQQVSSDPSRGTCLRCGHLNVIKPEDDRVGALVARIKEDEAASLGRFRDDVAPLI